MDLIYTTYPEITLSSNRFVNVPTILQFEDTPLLEIGKFVPAGYTTRLSVFHNDGTKIAVVKGSRIFLTEEGKKASLNLRHEPNLTVCELEGAPILELRKDEASALHGWAELYAPEGVLVKARDAGTEAMLKDGTELKLGGVMMQGCVVRNCRVGIRIGKDGSVAIGCN